MRIVTVRNRNHLSVFHSAGMNAESNSSRERTQLYYRYKNSTKSSHGNNPVLKSLESPGYCQACRINRRNQQFSVKAVTAKPAESTDETNSSVLELLRWTQVRGWIRLFVKNVGLGLKELKSVKMRIQLSPIRWVCSPRGPDPIVHGQVHIFFFFLLYDT